MGNGVIIVFPHDSTLSSLWYYQLQKTKKYNFYFTNTAMKFVRNVMGILPAIQHITCDITWDDFNKADDVKETCAENHA